MVEQFEIRRPTSDRAWHAYFSDSPRTADVITKSLLLFAFSSHSPLACLSSSLISSTSQPKVKLSNMRSTLTLLALPFFVAAASLEQIIAKRQVSTSELRLGTRRLSARQGGPSMTAPMEVLNTNAFPVSP